MIEEEITENESERVRWMDGDVAEVLCFAKLERGE